MPVFQCPKQPPFLSLREAAFRLGDRLLFQNTTWTMHRGEQWAIVGPNGSGKSVLADGLRGRLPLVQGELNYHFRPPAGLSPEETIGHVAFEDRKSEVHGTVVQSRWTSFEQEASVRVSEFLSYDRVMEVNPFEVSSSDQNVRRQFERRLRQALRLLGLRPFLSRRLLSLSNGERQRVQIARELARPLRLLILEEPYVGLDAAAREHFHRFLEQLLGTNLRILLVTARLEDLPEHVTHLMYVQDCRVVFVGPRAKVLSGLRGWERRRFDELGLGSVTSTRPRRIGGNLSKSDTGLRHFLSRQELAGSQRRARRARVKLIELRNITVRYGPTTILENLSWIVEEGESWALLGPNGSGKTTLLSLIQGDNPQAYVNEVMVFGQRRGNGESVWHLKKNIGWVSPELQLHFNDQVSVMDAVLSGFHQTIGLFEEPTRAQLAAAGRWLARFDLRHQADQPLFSLSAGLQRMTLLARALVTRPRLLILDEPCQGLDPAHRDLILQHVDALIRLGAVTTIFVTHRPDEIPSSIKRVLQLKKPAPA